MSLVLIFAFLHQNLFLLFGSKTLELDIHFILFLLKLALCLILPLQKLFKIRRLFANHNGDSLLVSLLFIDLGLFLHFESVLELL